MSLHARQHCPAQAGRVLSPTPFCLKSTQHLAFRLYAAQRRAAHPSPPLSHATSAPAAGEPVSTLQRMVVKNQPKTKKLHPEQHPNDEDGPSTSGRHKPEVLLLNGMRGLLIRNETPVGSIAGSLARMLRQEKRAALEFSTVLGIVKFLKTTALANQFLNQHQNALSFTFRTPSQRSRSTNSATGRQPGAGPLQPQQTADSQHAGDRAATGAMATASAATGSTGASGGGSSTGPEPVPWLPASLFRPVAWMRRMQVPEVDLRDPARGGVQMFDFSLDIRKEWRSVAYVSVDTSLAIADNIHAQLLAQVAADSAAGSNGTVTATPADIPAVRSKQRNGTTAAAPAAGSSTTSTTSATSTSSTSVHAVAGHAAPTIRTRPVLMGADMSQSVLVFAALAYLEQRLVSEKSPYMLGITVFRNTVAPRIDGRNGFVFRVQLVPRKQVAWVFRPQSARQPRTHQSNAAESGAVRQDGEEQPAMKESEGQQQEQATGKGKQRRQGSTKGATAVHAQGGKEEAEARQA